MGQPVAVVEKQTSRPGVVLFELNRSLTGMGHDSFASPADAAGTTPSAELARRMFATGQVAGMHVHGNIVTVALAGGADSAGLLEVARDLYQYWQPGMVPPAFEDLAPAEEAPAAGEPVAVDDAGLSEAAKRVPAHLLERSRLARERAKAKG